MMKICYVTNFLPGYHDIWAGAEVACYRLSKLLINNNQPVTFLTTRPNKASLEGLERYTIDTAEDYINKWGCAHPNGLWGRFCYRLKTCFSFDPISYISSRRMLKNIAPDLLHLHNFDKLSLSMIYSAKKIGIPVLFSIYDNWCMCPKRTLTNNKNERCKRYHGPCCITCGNFGLLEKFSAAFRRKVFDYFLNQIDAFIALSASSAKNLQNYGIKKERIAVIPLPVFEKAGGRLDITPEEDSILFTGWIFPHKGLHILIEAMPEVLKEIPNAKLYVIQSGENKAYKQRILNLIENLKITQHVFFLGKKTNQETSGFLQRVSLVVVPEQWEIEWPIFLTEAMASAKPIVASYIGNIPEFIEDGKTGFLADPAKPSSFADKIIWMLRNKKQAAEMGREAQKAGERIFDEDEILKKILVLYKEKKGGMDQR